jgi:hypothetical protein
MDADAESRHRAIAPSEIGSTSSPPPSGTQSPFAPITEGEAMRSPGLEGLDDPSTFSPMRSQMRRGRSGESREELDDPSSFEPKV